MNKIFVIMCSAHKVLDIVVLWAVDAWVNYYLCHLQEYITVFEILHLLTPNKNGYYGSRPYLELFLPFHSKWYVCFRSRNTTRRMSPSKDSRYEAEVIRLEHERTCVQGWRWGICSGFSTGATATKTKVHPSASASTERLFISIRPHPYSSHA